jgi:hypothetical protein
MDRRLLFPAIAAVACAHPAGAQTSDAEKALRARAEQFYQLEVNGDFRHAEAFVAEDTKDLYYRNSKPEILDFSIDKVAIQPDGVHATVTVNVSSTMKAPGFATMKFTSPVPTTWKLENGEWYWYQIQNGDIDTPFGKWHVGPVDPKATSAPPLPGMPVDPTNIAKAVTIDRTSVDLETNSSTPATLTITNHMSGAIDVKLASSPIQGLLVSIDKEKVAPGDRATVSFRAEAGAKPSGKVTIAAGPIQQFAIDVNTK